MRAPAAFLRHGLAARLLRMAFVAAVSLHGACASTTRVTPQSLDGSRTRVRVTYPGVQQQVVARAARGDSVLAWVDWIEGWPTAVRGDTLELQVAALRTDGVTRAIEPHDYTVVVPSESGARIHTRTANAVGTVMVVLLSVAAALGLAVAMNGGIY